jgi:hypothetical protein
MDILTIRGLRSTYAFDELADFVGKLIGLPRERARSFEHLACDISGPIRCLLDADNGLRDFMRAACHELSVSGDFMGHCGLLLYRRGDFDGDRLHLPNGMDDSAKVAGRVTNRQLNFRHPRADLFRGLSRFFRERLDLACHHRKTSAGGASASRFDGSVERQEIGLGGNLLDQFYNFTNSIGIGNQSRHGNVGASGLGYRHFGNPRRTIELSVNVGDGGGEFLSSSGDVANVFGGLLGRGFDGDRLIGSVPRRLLHGFGIGLQIDRRRQQRRNQFAGRGLEALIKSLQGLAPLLLGAVLVAFLLLCKLSSRDHAVSTELRGLGNDRNFVAAVKPRDRNVGLAGGY